MTILQVHLVGLLRGAMEQVKELRVEHDCLCPEPLNACVDYRKGLLHDSLKSLCNLACRLVGEEEFGCSSCCSNISGMVVIPAIPVSGYPKA